MSGSGLILGIESSCDETAASVVERGSRTLSSIIASQIATHARYGGVVPEIASREHLRAIVPIVRAAMTQANVTYADLDAIAVTAGPGLAGALLVGINFAKALAFAQGIPLIAVNHIEGHIHAVLLHERESSPESWPEGRNLQGDEPALALVVSGGHTHLFHAQLIREAWKYRLVGRTLDDAAGEAYDKVAKLLGFGYPGGPWVDALARFGNPKAVPFAFSQIKQNKLHLMGKTPRTKAARTAPIADLDPHFLFSFSGIKTAVLRYVELHNLRPEAEARALRLFGPQSGQAIQPQNSIHPDGDTCHPERAERVEGPASSSPPLLRRPAPKPPQSKEEALALCPQQVLDLIASFQAAVVGDLMKKTLAAAQSLGVKRILVTGGVAANRELRARFNAEGTKRGLRIAFPTLALSTDNAAMIAAAAWPRFVSGEFADHTLSGDPRLALGR